MKPEHLKDAEKSLMRWKEARMKCQALGLEMPAEEDPS